MPLASIIATIFLGLSFGMFGFTSKAFLIYCLSLVLFYTGWLMVHNWSEKNDK